MACTAALFGLNSLEQIVRREDWFWKALGFEKPPQLLGPADRTDFSGENIEEGRYQVFVTASFCHSSRWHYVNNMIMLGAIGPQLEAVVGPVALCAIYTGTGAAGWALTYLRNRYDITGISTEEFPADMRWECGMKFQSSNGSSPATYGLAVAAACLVAPSVAVGPIFGGAESIGSVNPWVSWGSTALGVFAAEWMDAKDKGDAVLPVLKAAAALAIHSGIHLTIHLTCNPLW